MICKKCGHENSADEIFCERCDHKLDEPYVKERTAFIPLMYAILAALALGVAALVISLVFTDIDWFVPVIAGGIGLFLGTYSLSVVRMSENSNRTVFLILAAAAIIMSAAGLLLGIAGYE
ncbi:MAG: zinc ribbon domain-containing protein, partial [Methanomassiliicoccaceae archaeon]|nr:zinc ribbon domain-containing protein [Methanomassiliicoccaceae archaeon]